MYFKEKMEVLNCAKQLEKYKLIALSGGNVSMRLPDGNLLVTPSGMIYNDMDPEDIVLVSIDGEVIEGSRRVSVDTIALSHIFKEMPEINAIIHTHQPYATGIGLVENEIDCNLTTLANTVKGSVSVAPYTSAASLDMGEAVVKYIGDKLAVVLKNHGVVTVGKNLKEALYAAVYLEEAAKTIFIAKAYGGDISTLSEDEIVTAVKVFEDYGQK